MRRQKGCSGRLHLSCRGTAGAGISDNLIVHLEAEIEPQKGLICTVNVRCYSLWMSLHVIKAERTCHQLEQEAARLSSQAAKERQIAKQAELNLAMQGLRV